VLGVCALSLAGSASGGNTAGADRVVRFANLPRGWVKGIPRDVRPKSRIVGVIGGHRVATGPTRNGNYCMAFSASATRRGGGFGGCVVRGAHSTGAADEVRPYLIASMALLGKVAVITQGGSVDATPCTRLFFVYADGTQARVPLTFVSRPIGAGFFFKSIAAAHRTADTRLRYIELRRDSKLIARRRAAVSPG